MSPACPKHLAPRAQTRLVTRTARFAVFVGLASLAVLVSTIASASAQDTPGDASQSIYTCPAGATLDGNSCVTDATTVWKPGEYVVNAGPVGSCPPEWELDGIFCYLASPSAKQTCPEGGAPDPAQMNDDGTIGRCVADATAQPQCPAGYLAVDDTCLAEPIDAGTCPAGGEINPDAGTEDGTVLTCRAQPVGTSAICPANYVNTDGVCTAAPLETEETQTCTQGELIDGQCRLNAKFMSASNATCNGEPTSKPASECGSWELQGGQRVPATVNTQPTPVPVPMHILGDDTRAAVEPTATQVPSIVLNSAPSGDETTAVTAPQIDLSGGADAPTDASSATGFTVSSPTPTALVPVPTGHATTTGESPDYQWGASREDTPKRRPALAFTGSAAKPLVVTALGMMASGFMAVEFNRRLRKHDARKHLPQRFR